MKRFYMLVLLALLVFPFASTARVAADTSYTSKSGITFTVGQKVTIGLGTGTDGKFRYIVKFNLIGLPQIDEQLPAQFATQQVTITKIKRQKAVYFKKDAAETVYLIFKTDRLTERYGINIEPALLAKEIIIQ
jgi:hypothetical protein